MDIHNLIPAVLRLQASTPSEGSRAETYLRTYPALLSLAASAGVDDATRFLHLALGIYGWMPRILRVDPRSLDRAVTALRRATAATDTNDAIGHIEAVAECLQSVVGASKLLHFANPGLFPIWDRNVEGFRQSANPSQHHMGQVKNYIAYATEVHAIRNASMFSEFHRAFNQAFEDRLRRLRIAVYPVTEVRCVELAMFELASDQYSGNESAQ
jgi:hypothetical protein